MNKNRAEDVRQFDDYYINVLKRSVFRNDGEFLQAEGCLYDLRLNKPTNGAVVGPDVYPSLGLNEPDISFTKDRQFYARANNVYNREHLKVFDFNRGGSCFMTNDDKLCVTSGNSINIINWRMNELEDVYRFDLDNNYSWDFKINNFLYGVEGVGYPKIKMVNSKTFNEQVITSSTPSGMRSWSIHNQSKDGKKVILSANQLSYKILDTLTQKIIDIQAPISRVNKSSFSNDGKYVIIIPDLYEELSNTLRIYNTDTGKLHATLEQPLKFLNAVFRWDDVIISVHEHGHIGYWNLEKAELIAYTRLRAY